MNYTVVSVKDLAQEAYATPFHVPSAGYAIRSFRDEVNRDAADNQLNRHPEDFELYKLGTFNTETGNFDQAEGIQRLARAVDLKENK